MEARLGDMCLEGVTQATPTVLHVSPTKESAHTVLSLANSGEAWSVLSHWVFLPPEEAYLKKKDKCLILFPSGRIKRKQKVLLSS